MGAFLLEVKMKEKIEVRSFPIEFRAEGEDPKLIGHAALFDELSDDLGGFREKIRKGAFANSIQTDDIRALFNHDSNYVLGRNTKGTLKLKEDERGLAIEIDPPGTQFAKDLMVLIERGDINQMSFGFITKVDEWDSSDENNVIRTLVEVQLWDVSPVTYPAYPKTEIGVNAKDIFNEFQTKQKQELELVESKKAEEVQAQERKEALRQVKKTKNLRKITSERKIR